jgi:hypothetical protein
MAKEVLALVARVITWMALKVRWGIFSLDLIIEDFANQDTNGFYMLQRVSYAAEFMFESQSIKGRRDLNCGWRLMLTQSKKWWAFFIACLVLSIEWIVTNRYSLVHYFKTSWGSFNSYVECCNTSCLCKEK